MSTRTTVADETVPLLRFVFRASLHLLVCLASGMLAWAEGAGIPVLFTIPLAIVAFVVTGPHRGVHLPNFLANLAGAVALFACYSEFSRGDQEARLLAGAHLLVYLVWIVLFQKKTVGTYWWIVALTLLQVAVGSLLRQSADYGVFVVVYALGAIWTLSVFSVYRAYTAADGNDGDGSESNAPPVPDRPFGELRSPSSTSTTVQLDDRPGVLGLRFATGVVGTTLGSLVISFLVFLMFPRVWIGQHPFARGGAGTSITGFSETVKLGDESGTILESTKRVLEVRMSDVDTGNSVDVEDYAARLGYDEPLFRGKVLDLYLPANREWIGYTSGDSVPTDVEDQPGSIRQHYRLEATESRVLFTMQPVRTVFTLDDSGPVPVDRGSFSTEYNRRQFVESESIEYVAYSHPTRQQGSVQEEEIPWNFQFLYLRDLVGVPGLLRIREFVAEERAALRSGRTTPREVAERLESYLQNSGTFGYTLEGAPIPRGRDPVEHFLFTRREGHCEYFASALALLLRASGIPARVVNGFKGGTRNRFTGYFEVEQRHAHAWVEAYLTDAPIAFSDRRGQEPLWRQFSRIDYGNMRDGRWVVLDPTPAGPRSASVESQARSVRSWSDFKRLVADQWDWYVLKMNIAKQRDQFFDPLKGFAVDAWHGIRGDVESRQSLRQRLTAIWNSPETWFSPVGFVVTFVVLTLLFGLTRLVWYLVSLVLARRFGRGDRAGGRGPARVLFYERFTAACRRLGLRRKESQTHSEFAEVVRGYLAERSDEGGAERPEHDSEPPATLPDDVVRDFHAVRFGDESLPVERLVELERQLAAFEASVARRVGRRSLPGRRQR